MYEKFSWSQEMLFYHASEKGRIDVVRWLLKLFSDRACTIRYAAQGRKLDFIKWMMEQSQWDELVDEAFIVAVARGHLETAQFLKEKRTSMYMGLRQDVASYDDLEMKRWSYKSNDSYRCGYSCADAAASNGHFEMVQWLHVNFSTHFSARTMDCAATNGHLEIVKFLHVNRQEGCTTKAMDGAAGNGHFNMLRWLHDNRSEGCTTNAMDSAASHDHLHVLQWLHENHNEGFISDAMTRAVNNNRFDIVKWIYECQEQHDFSMYFVNKLAQSGNLEMVMWLHSTGKGKWTKDAMNEAAACGHLEIVKFLHENRREGCSTQAMNNAAGNNHMEVVKWLYANRREGGSVLAMANVATGGHLEMVQWLHAHGKGCAPSAMPGAAGGGHTRVMEFLVASFPEKKWSTTSMKYAIENHQMASVK